MTTLLSLLNARLVHLFDGFGGIVYEAFTKEIPRSIAVPLPLRLVEARGFSEKFCETLLK